MGGLYINQKLFRKIGLMGLMAICVTIGIIWGITSTYGLSLDLGLPLNIPALYDGGFIVESAVVDGYGCMMAPVMQDNNVPGSTSNTKKLMIRNTMDSATIQGMKITKVIILPDQIRSSVGYDAVKLIMTAGDGAPVTITGLKMDISGMKCTLATLGLFEQDSNGVMKMLNMKLEDAVLTAHHMEAENITLTGFKLSFELCNSSES
ncbi:MAG: hypothetical protein ACM3QW_02740 [Ignavibacteriales bacterium]